MIILQMNALTLQSQMIQMVMNQTSTALRLMTAEAEIHDNFDTTRLNEETDYLNL